ncbi:MAG: hypothetical protein HN542_08105 [Flavobacteriales bacterium]|jgi:hypothetical protein|nr:hypothetical protein [Flavobacteriales bacterium]MBT3963508.1 hypothetical protein [Flavobacteriales bacterium]MBT4704275.1 hypothetical protein [Flavobacteriales bacterium]MBT6132101.1 hypothetical protein [Flavobacteriales bacterium]MBT6382063.1 hypothetical protein [Flavobacteriales bacterium]
MNDSTDSLSALQDIKSLMEKSSRFISLSGLAGVFSGIFALIGAAAAYWRVNLAPWAVRDEDTPFGTGNIVNIDTDVAMFLLLDALIVLIVSVAVAYYFTKRKAARHGQALWGPYSRHMLRNLAIPVGVGGLFCILLFYHGLIGLIAPSTLIFYGLALINAGRFSLEEISYLGISEVILGLACLLLLGYGLIFWAIGFGVLHIVYGILMYIRHDR